MFGLADLKKINDRAAAPGRRHGVLGRSVMRLGSAIATAENPRLAREIAEALNTADAVAEANANAVGRT